MRANTIMLLESKQKEKLDFFRFEFKKRKRKIAKYNPPDKIKEKQTK